MSEKTIETELLALSSLTQNETAKLLSQRCFQQIDGTTLKKSLESAEMRSRATISSKQYK